MDKEEMSATYALLRTDVERETKDLECLLKARSGGYVKIGSSNHDISLNAKSTEGLIVADAIQQVINYKREKLKLIMRESQERI